MKRLLGAAFMATILGTAAMPAQAESVCDSLTGAANGLCRAYVEALECEFTPDAKGCAHIAEQYERITGEPIDSLFVPCPCEIPTAEDFLAGLEMDASVSTCSIQSITNKRAQGKANVIAHFTTGGESEASIRGGESDEYVIEQSCFVRTLGVYESWLKGGIGTNEFNSCRMALQNLAAALGIACTIQ